MSGANGHGANRLFVDVENAVRTGATHVARAAVNSSQVGVNRFITSPAKDVIGLLRDYGRDHLEVVVVWTFVAGLVVGWRLRR